MGKFSTLIYLVNNIENELHTTNNPEVENDVELPVSMEYEPSERSIKNILDFARSYDVVQTKTAGHVEMILN